MSTIQSSTAAPSAGTTAPAGFADAARSAATSAPASTGKAAVAGRAAPTFAQKKAVFANLRRELYRLMQDADRHWRFGSIVATFHPKYTRFVLARLQRLLYDPAYNKMFYAAGYTPHKINSMAYDCATLVDFLKSHYSSPGKDIAINVKWYRNPVGEDATRMKLANEAHEALSGLFIAFNDIGMHFFGKH